MFNMKEDVVLAIVAMMQNYGLWEPMVNTVENSPWHREDNVAVHTQMTINAAFNHEEDLSSFFTDHDWAMIILTLAFHDVGKPVSEETKWSDNLGDYYRTYKGHEKVSARMWEDFYAAHSKTLFNSFRITKEDFYVIAWMIENHLPYQLKDKNKLRSLANTLDTFLPSRDIFYMVLMADCIGRDSDDHDTKIANVLNWIYEFDENYPKQGCEPIGNTQQKLHVLIGASGSGKSSFKNDILNHSHNIFFYSLDNLRIQYYLTYGDDGIDVPSISDEKLYELAFDFCNEYRDDFKRYSDEMYRNMVNAKGDIILDNTNTSKKNRRFFIQEAKNRGYAVVAYLFPITKNELETRHLNRTDKQVPWNAVVRQYESLSMPSIGEVDDVIVFPTNL